MIQKANDNKAQQGGGANAGKNVFLQKMSKFSPKSFYQMHWGNGRPAQERKLVVLLDNYNEAFSDFEDEEVPPSMKRVLSKDFLEEIKGQYALLGKNGRLSVELSIPRHLRRQENEENVIEKLKSHFAREAEELKKSLRCDKIRGAVYVLTGMFVTSLYDSLKDLGQEQGRLDFGALTAQVIRKIDYFFSLENLEAKIMAGLIYAVEVAGWFGLFMGFEKLVEKKIVSEASVEFKDRLRMAKELARAEYSFVQRTRAGYKPEQPRIQAEVPDSKA